LFRLLFLLITLAYSTVSLPANQSSVLLPQIPVLLPQVLETKAHNANWFTQGFYTEANTFYISSGQYGKSQLIVQSPSKIIRFRLPRRYFAEGLTVIDDKLYLLTWKENTLFIFDKNTLQKQATLPYEGEGWGLTDNDHELIMSNGSNQLLFRDPKTFAIRHTITIPELNNINELEYVDGIIWANRWYDDYLYAIDSQKGCVLAKMDLEPLRKQSVTPDNKNITNGIAYDKQRQGLWLTGKFWSKRFLIQLPTVKKLSC
jgi:glutamine cyclotransferase